MIMTQEKDDELIQKTIEVWQPYFTRPLQVADAEEIIGRWTGFIQIIGQALASSPLPPL